MLPHEKKKIEKFYHPQTIKTFIGKHASKEEKKQKMKFLLLCATQPAARDVVPGRWLMDMDRKFRDGKP